MNLKHVVDKTMRELNDKKWSLIALAAARATDITTTVLNAYKTGTVEYETNSFARGMMESYGPLKGLLLSEVQVIPWIIGAYGLGKFLGLLSENTDLSKYRRILENLPLAALASLSFRAAANNLYYLLK